MSRAPDGIVLLAQMFESHQPVKIYPLVRCLSGSVYSERVRPVCERLHRLDKAVDDRREDPLCLVTIRVCLVGIDDKIGLVFSFRNLGHGFAVYEILQAVFNIIRRHTAVPGQLFHRFRRLITMIQDVLG